MLYFVLFVRFIALLTMPTQSGLPRSTSIGSSESHKAVMENPDFISKVVLDKGLDSGTA